MATFKFTPKTGLQLFTKILAPLNYLNCLWNKDLTSRRFEQGTAGGNSSKALTLLWANSPLTKKPVFLVWNGSLGNVDLLVFVLSQIKSLIVVSKYGSKLLKSLKFGFTMPGLTIQMKQLKLNPIYQHDSS